MKTTTIMVLEDGTWITVSGCRIVVLTEEDFRMLSNGHIDASDAEPLSEITLRDTTPRPENNY